MGQLDDFLDSKPAAGSGIGRIDSFLGPEPPTLSGEFGKGITAGIKGAQQGAYGLASMAGRAIGSDTVEQWGNEGVQRKEVELQQNPLAVGDLRDIGGVKDAALWAAGGLGQLVPFMATSAVTGGVGGAVGGAIGKGAAAAAARQAVGEVAKRSVIQKAAQTGVQRGAVAGAGLSTTGMETGSIYADQITEGQTPDPGKALAYGIPAGLLDVLPQARVIGKVLGKGATEAEKVAARAAGKAVPKEIGVVQDVLTQMGLEGSTEAAQTVLERMGANKLPFSEEGIWEAINAGAVGALGGGVIGGAGRAYQSLRPKEQAPAPIPDQSGAAPDQGATVAPLQPPVEAPSTPPIQRDETGASVHPADTATVEAALQPNAGPLTKAAGIAATPVPDGPPTATEQARLNESLQGAMQDTVKQEQQALSELEAADARVQEQRQKESEIQRRAMLDAILEDSDVRDPVMRYRAELGRAGYKGEFALPTKEELDRIKRFRDVQAAVEQEHVDAGTAAGTPNEMDVSALVKERAPAKSSGGSAKADTQAAAVALPSELLPAARAAKAMKKDGPTAFFQVVKQRTKVDAERRQLMAAFKAFVPTPDQQAKGAERAVASTPSTQAAPAPVRSSTSATPSVASSQSAQTPRVEPSPAQQSRSESSVTPAAQQAKRSATANDATPAQPPAGTQQPPTPIARPAAQPAAGTPQPVRESPSPTPTVLKTPIVPPKSEVTQPTDAERLAGKRAMYQAYGATGAPADVVANSVLRAQEKANERQEPMTLWRGQSGTLGLVPATAKSPLVGGVQIATIHPEQSAPVDSTGAAPGAKGTVDAAAHQSAASPKNDLPTPTEAQREAGNFKMGHATVAGLPVTIEHPEGTSRKPGWQKLKSHYGYVKRALGADKENFDVFIKPGTPENYDGPIFVVDQTDKDGKFDEHKGLIGYPNMMQARIGYAQNYPKDFTVGKLTQMSAAQFKDWLANGDTSKPLAGSPQPVNAVVETPAAKSTVVHDARGVLAQSKGQLNAFQLRILQNAINEGAKVENGTAPLTREYANKLRKIAESVSAFKPAAGDAVRVLADHVDSVRPKSQMELNKAAKEQADAEKKAENARRMQERREAAKKPTPKPAERKAADKQPDATAKTGRAGPKVVAPSEGGKAFALAKPYDRAKDARKAIAFYGLDKTHAPAHVGSEWKILPKAQAAMVRQRNARSRQQAEEARTPGQANNTLLKRLFHKFGIQVGEVRDISGEGSGSKTGAMVGTFRKDGRGVDEWGRVLVSEGWLSPMSDSERGNENIEADVDDVRALMRKVFDGEEVFPAAEQDSSAEKLAQDEWAERESDVTGGKLSPEEIAELTDPELTREENEQAFDAARFLSEQGLNEGQIERIIERASIQDGNYEESIRSLAAAESGNAQGAGAAQAETLTLTGQTNAEALAAEKVKPDQAADDKRLADAQVGGFSLSPPKGAVTQAAVNNPKAQQSLLSPKDAPEALGNAAARPTTNSKGQPIHVKGVDNFWRWFAGSKTVDDQGRPIVMYHGAQRPDRIGNVFKRSRAQAGPMAFFTNSPELASNYAQGKPDTSLDRPDDYAGWFKYKVPGSRSTVNIDRAWYFLPAEERQRIAERLPRVANHTVDGDEMDGYRLGGPDERGLSDKGHWDHYIKQARGNVLEAAKEIWLNSAALYNNEEEFMQVLKLGGMDMKAVEFDHPHAAYSAVIPVYLNIKTPLVTTSIPQSVMDALEKASKRQRARPQLGNDAWAKSARVASDWMAELKKDVADGKNSHAWTSIPDWVTRVLQDFGYDGIHDKSGKNSGEAHDVWIPFHETQVKSATGNKGTFDGTKNSTLANAADDLAALRKKWEAKGVKLDVYPRGKSDLTLSLITVPQGQRNQGIGTEAMRDVIHYADANGLRIVLSPDSAGSAFGTTSRSRLVDFYKRFGFVENKGRNKDFTISDTMYRAPLANVADRAQSQGSNLDANLFILAAQSPSIKPLLEHISRSGKPLQRLIARALIRAGINPEVQVRDKDTLKLEELPKAHSDAERARFKALQNKASLTAQESAELEALDAKVVPRNQLSAMYTPTEDGKGIITLYNMQTALQDIIHESLHAATYAAYRKGGLAAIQMRMLYNHAKKFALDPTAYGWTNVDEFIAESHANPDFQRFLRGVPPIHGMQAKNAWHAFVTIVRNILGLDKTAHNALSQALEVGSALIEEGRGINGGVAESLGGRVTHRVKGMDGITFAKEHGNPLTKAYRAIQKAADAGEITPDEYRDQNNTAANAFLDDVAKRFGDPETAERMFARLGLRRESEGFFRDLEGFIRDHVELAITTGPNRQSFQGAMKRLAASYSVNDTVSSIMRSDFSDEAQTAAKNMMAAMAGAIGYKTGSGAPQLTGPSSFANRAQTFTKAFRDWFGKSAVVDEKGEPLVVYHGTHRDFGEFKSMSWASADPQHASDYAIGGAELRDGGNGAATVFPVYMKIAQPFDADAASDGEGFTNIAAIVDSAIEQAAEQGHPVAASDAAHYRSSMQAAWNRMGMDDSVVNTHHHWSMVGQVGRMNLRDMLQQMGFDGIKYTERYDYAKEALTFAAFDPSQIKSATGNSGNFDPSNPSILGNAAGGRVRSELPRKSFESAKALFEDMTRSDRVLNRVLSKFNTPYHIAQTHPDFAPVYDEAQDFNHDISRYAKSAADQAPDLLVTIDGMRDFKKKAPSNADIKAVSSALYEGTFYGGGSPLDGKAWTDAELKSGRDAATNLPIFDPLNDGQIKLYRQALSAIADSLTENSKSMLWRVARTRDLTLDREGSLDQMAGEAKDAADREIERLNTIRKADAERIKEQIAATTAEDLRLNSGHKTDLEKKEARNAEKHAEQIAELEAFKSAADDIFTKTQGLIDHGYFPAMRFGKYAVYAEQKNPDGSREQIDFSRFDTQMAANAYKRQLQAQFPNATVTSDVMNEDAYKLFQGLNLDAMELFAEHMVDDQGNPVSKDPLMQQFFRVAASERSSLKRQIHRKGVAGYSTDIPRALAQFTVSQATATSRNYHAAPMLQKVRDIKGGDLQSYATRYVKYLQDPQEESGPIRGFLANFFILGSIASSAVNMTQPILMSAPALSEHTSWTKAMAELGKAAKDIVTGKKTLTPRERADYERAAAAGTVSPQEIHQLRADTRTSMLGDSQVWQKMESIAASKGVKLPGKLAMRKIAYLWGSIYSLTEQFNRGVTFLAAHRIAVANGVADPFKFATDMVDSTQGVYAKTNRPVFTRGTVLAVAGTFKQFTVAYLELAKRLYTHDKKAFAVMMLTLMAMAGTSGLPFADDVSDLLDTLGQWMGFATNTKKAMRKWAQNTLGNDIADLMQYGVSGIPGMPIDVSARLGMHNILPGSALFKTAEPNKARDILELLGPAASVLQNAGGAIQGLATGDIGKTRYLMPLALQNVAQGADMLSSGAYRDRAGRKVMDVDTVDSLFKTIGFQPNKVAAESRIIGQNQQDKDLQRVIESGIVARIAQSAVEKDPELRMKAYADLQAWNQTNPELRITITPQQIQSRIRNMMDTREQRTIRQTAPELRSQVAQDLRGLR